MTLKQLWEKGGTAIYPTDKEYTHHYLDTYDKLFALLQKKKINIFECGYGDGGSCKLWEDYFSKAQIRSIDIEKRDYVWSNGGKDFPVHSNRVRLDYIDFNNLPPSYFDDFPVDIAIEDGSHYVAEQILFINLMYPLLRKGGMVIIEDIYNIDEDKKYFDELKMPFEVVDLRNINSRSDNVLLIFRK